MEQLVWKIRFFFHHFSENLKRHHFFSLCATTSFYFLFTLIPFIILIFLLLTRWVSNSEIIFNELNEITNNLLPEISDRIMSQVKQFTTTKGLGWIWFVVLFWAASPLAQALRKNFQLIFNYQIKRKFITNKLIDIIVLLAIIFLFFIYFILSKYLDSLANVFHGLIPFSEKSLIIVIFSSMLILLIMSVFFRIMIPVKKFSRVLILIGAGVTCFIWISLHEMFDFIMSMSQAYGIFYGSMRNLFVSLIWLFLNIAGLLIGVEIISFIYEKNQYKYRMLFLNPSKLLLKIYFQQDIIRYKKDEIVFNHDNPSLFVYFVVDGQIETTINGNQRVISNNNYFGELSIINNTKRVGNARVVSDWAKVIKIPNALFKKLLRQDIEFQNLILKNLNKIIIN